MSFLRINAQTVRELSVSASDFWEILIDWGALMDWIPKLDENPPAPVSGCEMLASHSIDALPCTRRVYLQSGGVGQDYLDETLIHFDHATRRLYYTFGGIGPGGVRNYLATTFIDETGSSACRVTCASQFDIAADAASDMKAFVEEFYDRAIIQGIAKLIAIGSA